MTVAVDYTTVGHVTVDVLADGTRRAGGSAFYAALQAARLGASSRIVTRGARAEIEALLEPYAHELDVHVLEAAHTTTLQTSGAGATREQRVLAWAGEIDREIALDTEIAHLAPIARETPSRWRGRARFVGVTPQGLVRGWSRDDGRLLARALDVALLPARCDAVVLSESERASCAALLERAGRRAPLVAVTAAAAPTELRLGDGTVTDVAVAAVAEVCDDIGAGDVFAAAFFIALADGAAPAAAARFANAAAAVRIAGSGAAAIGDRAAVEARAAAVAG